MGLKHLIFLLVLISLPVLAFGSAGGKDAAPAPEAETYLSTFKSSQIEDSITDSPEFIKCVEDNKKKDPDNAIASIKSCAEQKFGFLLDDDEAIKKLASDFDLASFDKDAAKSSKSIREYLSQRLDAAIYGKAQTEGGDFKKLADKTYINHETYFQLYKEQIGKNTLLLSSQYCLENFGYKDPKKLVTFLPDQNAKSGYSLRAVDAVESDGNGGYRVVGNLTKAVKDAEAVGLWSPASDIKEFEVCSSDKCDAGASNTNKRSITLATALKNASFEIAESIEDTKILERNYGLCVSSLIHNMCEIYKCENIYKAGTDEATTCNAKYGITNSLNKNAVDPSKLIDIKTKNSEQRKGQLACNLLEELKSYRQAYNRTEDIEKQMKAEGVSVSGLDISALKVRQYENKGNNSIDSLTSISSTELIKGATDLAQSEQTAEKLREDCMIEENNEFVLKPGAYDDPKCQDLRSALDDEEVLKIELDTEARSTAFLKQLDELKADGAEFKKFLEEHNLTEYLAKLEGDDAKNIDQLTEAQIIELIKNDHLTQKNAELDAIKAKFRTENNLAANGTDPLVKEANENAIATENLADIEQHKQRVQNLFQYSNIVSSYLSIQEGVGDDAKTVGSNSTGRRLEVGNIDKDGDNSETLKYFEGDSSSSSSGQSLDYNQVFEAVFNEKKDDPVKNQ